MIPRGGHCLVIQVWHLQGEKIMTKERMKDLLIIGMSPFLVVVWNNLDFNFLGEPRVCDVIHVNAPIGLKCEKWEIYEKEKLYSRDS